MHSIAVRRESPVERAQGEAIKAVRFAQRHGAWPLDLSPAAGVALARRDDADSLQEKWGDLAEAIVLAH